MTAGTSSALEVRGTNYQEFSHLSIWRPCWHCRELTRWVHAEFMAALHPGLCAEAKANEYFEVTFHEQLPPEWDEPPIDWTDTYEHHT